MLLEMISNDFLGRGERGEKDDTLILINAILKQNEIKTPILDLGCGNGYYHKYMPDFNFVGVDNCNQFELNSNSYIQHDLNIYPYDCIDDRYDTIISLDTIEHLYRPDLFLKNVWDNLLNQNGLFLLCVPNIDNIDDKLSNMNISVFDPRLKEATNNRWTSQHIRFFNVDSIAMLTQEIGFKLLGIIGCNYYVSTLGKLICDRFNKTFNIPIEYINRELGYILPTIAPNILFVFKKE